MCIIEIWSYSECGCRFENIIPCHQNDDTSFESSSSSSGATFGTRASSCTRAHLREVRTPSLPLTTLSSPPKARVLSIENVSDSAHHCTFLQSTHRSFLEPICDLCVLDEHKIIMAHYAQDNPNGGSLVWESEVKIEIDMPEYYQPNLAHNQSTRQSVDTSSTAFDEPRVDCRQGRHQERVDQASNLADDADDESSLYITSPKPAASPQLLTDVRGRPRSCTKQLRRRGVDLSRDELRISSRWTSGEKRSMENFRDAIKQKAADTPSKDGDNTLSKWIARRSRPIINDAKLVKDRFTTGFRGSKSKSQAQRTRTSIMNNDTTTRSTCSIGKPLEPFPAVKPGSLQPVMRFTQRQVHSAIPSHKQTLMSEGEDASFALGLRTNLKAVPSHDLHNSWQHHLEHDLPSATDQRLHQKKAKYIAREESDEQRQAEERSHGHSVLHPGYFPDHGHECRQGSDSRPLLQPSSTVSVISQRNIESYWRLPSIVATDLARSSGTLQTSTSYPAQLERLGELVNSSDFESQDWSSDSHSRSLSLSQSRYRSTSDQNQSSATADLNPGIEARLRFAQAGQETDNEERSLQPLSSMSDPYTMKDNDEQRDVDIENQAPAFHATIHLPSSSLTTKNSGSSMSLPEQSVLGSRHTSYEHTGNGCIRRSNHEATGGLAMHSFNTRLPGENLVRPSIGMHHNHGYYS